SRPKSEVTSGLVNKEPPSCGCSAGGMKGDQLASFTKKQPTTTTASTTSTLIVVTTWLIQLDSLTPVTKIAVSPSTRSPAGKFKKPSSAVAMACGISKGVPARTTPRYSLKEVASA